MKFCDGCVCVVISLIIYNYFFFNSFNVEFRLKIDFIVKFVAKVLHRKMILLMFMAVSLMIGGVSSMNKYDVSLLILMIFENMNYVC